MCTSMCSDARLVRKVKSSHQKAAGLLQPLPIPDGPFQDISMDFIGPLPASHPSRNTLCFITVDRFSKYVMLIPCKHIVTAEEVARHLHSVLVSPCRFAENHYFR